MSNTSPKLSNAWTGIALAVLATIIWSGNFVVARAIIHEIPPVALAFFRWLTASVLILPLAWHELRREWPIVKAHLPYFLFTALMGISLFNTLVYIAGHYSPAINLALIGTTSSPIIAIILARMFLKEKVPLIRIAGLSLCITGILYLLSKGSWQNLLGFHFSPGDIWVLLGAAAFSTYTILVRKKPAGISARAFLFVLFSLGTLLLLPAYLWESGHYPPIQWNASLAGVILYLGLGTSVISFLCWNAAITRIGAARTSLFGNLIPIFSSIEAVWLLQEKITMIHLVSGLLVITGLVIANLSVKRS
ncbi:DMT family transporter [Flavihumibacter fluvii]|uniref:DMT family transporter n=1 Tax=Flavihumibacter fluvii TaxID=2838157 RepID=UPI001BDDDEC2|nr:DMT family transporter [Flavihumibacter fluvii]ULQ54329.1 DMT family transporter [Flavihumibacter fluvii]